jgi:hypothetical protein
MSDIDVQKMNAEQRLAETARRSSSHLPSAIQHQVQEFIKTESLLFIDGEEQS